MDDPMRKMTVFQIRVLTKLDFLALVLVLILVTLVIRGCNG